MNLPPFVKSLAFWKGVSFLVAGILALLVYFGVVPPEWGIPAEVVLSIILAILQFIGVKPELRDRGLL